jgi:hypothetical protein
MAKFEVKYTKRPVQKIETVPVYTLELSLEEMILLRDLVERIGGHPADTARKYSDSILTAIRSIGVYVNLDVMTGRTNSIYYTEQALKQIEEAVDTTIKTHSNCKNV